jgi:hypothetical protein
METAQGIAISTGQRQRAETPGKLPLPEFAPGGGAQPALDLDAQLAGQLRERREAVRQRGLQPLAQAAGEHGRGPARGDRDHQRRTVHDGGHDEAAGRGIVHAVHQDVTSLALGMYPPVHGPVVGGGNRQQPSRHQARLERPTDVPDPALAAQGIEVRMQLRGIDRDHGARGQQQPDLP